MTKLNGNRAYSSVTKRKAQKSLDSLKTMIDRGDDAYFILCMLRDSGVMDRSDGLDAMTELAFQRIQSDRYDGATEESQSKPDGEGSRVGALGMPVIGTDDVVRIFENTPTHPR